ncbi:White-brown complex protein 11 [Heracleum sosnowskyi]|uniref:White-brown complex protein 11 n=1 Tax=Heracleum sosnowskyi TaxID=360622 RepID=A0AAD8MGA7_9APIA|nr:White-brown complex protein 11 [Heracleum sosnowskyi]
MDSPDKVSRWTPLVSPTRSILTKFMTTQRTDQSEPPTPEEGENVNIHNTYIAPDIEADDVPFNKAASSTSTPPRSPRLYGSSSKKSRSRKSDDVTSLKSVRSEDIRRRSRKVEEHNGVDINQVGIYITWSELWVTVPLKRGGRRPLLDGLTGYVQPGECLAIMGPSGCGKSILLDTLSGRLRTNTTQTGDILINGRKQTLAFGTSAYVTQDDTLMTTLTVIEAVYYSAQLQLPDSMSRVEKKERAEMTIKDMGLQDAMNTRIGGWSVKGLSGGQKRRVSICIEILTNPKLLFMDEPTSGLDSAASYHVMSRIIKLAKHDKRTVIASIHQPSGEVFELFNNLCLLSSGRQIYFGPTARATEFFASSGFPCPAMRNPSDHFLRTVNKDFDVDIKHGHGGDVVTAKKAIDILVKAYLSSETRRQAVNKVYEICQKHQETIVERDHQASFITQCQVLTRRSFVNMFRDLGYYWLRFIIYLGLCVCIGTIFHDIGHTYGSIQDRGSMLSFVAGFLTFMAIGGFPSFVEDMKIFGRERLNGHYGVASFVVGNTISSAPYLCFISVVPGAIAYFLVGVQSGFEHFLYFSLLLFASMLLVESIMLLVASIVPDFLMGIITGAGIQGIMMLNGGYFRLPRDIPKPFWKYPVYYISFHKYAFQGFYKNEFLGLTFPNAKVGGPPTISGEEILRDLWQVEMYSKWVNLAILLGMVVVYRFMFFVIIKASEKLKPMIAAYFSSSRTKADGFSTAPSVEPGCSVRRVRAFSLFDCRCYTVDVTYAD